MATLSQVWPRLLYMSDDRFTDDQLEALALAADPDQPIANDAEAFTADGMSSRGLLPSWYMPAPVIRVHKRWHVPVVTTIIAAFAVINGLGLCITYGHLVIA